MERDDKQVAERPRGRPGRTRLVRSLWAAGLALALVALGVAAGVWGERRASSDSSARGKVAAGGVAPGAMAMPPASGSAAAPAADPPAEVTIELTGDALTRAGIKTTAVSAVESSTSVRVPGTVMANAYREVKITPIVGGIVRAVPVALGDSVRRGAPVITLFSAELADAQTKYLSMAAMLEADRRDRGRQPAGAGRRHGNRREPRDGSGIRPAATAPDRPHAGAGAGPQEPESNRLDRRRARAHRRRDHRPNGQPWPGGEHGAGAAGRDEPLRRLGARGPV